MQKKPRENTHNSKNGRILKIAKIGRNAGAIAYEKIINLGQNLKIPKRCEKQSYDHIRVVVCKKSLEKNA